MKTKAHKEQCPADPNHASFINMKKAENALRLGEPNTVLSEVNQVLASDPNHVGALELLAKAQWQLDKSHALLETLAKLIRINPYEPGYQMLRGAALKNLGRYGEAVRAYVRADGAVGASDAVAEVSAIQSELVLQLLAEDPLFKVQYGQNPEKACTARGFEFGSQTKIRHRALVTEFSPKSLLVRPS